MYLQNEFVEIYLFIYNNNDFSWLCKNCKSKSEKRKSVAVNASNTLTTTSSRVPTPKINNNIKKSDNQEEIIAKLNKSLNIQLELQKEMSDIKIMLANYKIIVESLQQENIDLKNHNEKLQNHICAVEYNFENYKQSLFSCDLLISGSGIHEEKNEDLFETVECIAKELEIIVKQEDIYSITRKPSTSKNSGEARLIDVKFNRKNIRDKFIDNKKGKQLKINIIKDHKVVRSIYISEKLTERY